MISPVESYGQPISHEIGFLPLAPEVPLLPAIPNMGEHITQVPGLPGVLCQNCLAKNGDKNWVVPGLPCSKCGTTAPSQV